MTGSSVDELKPLGPLHAYPVMAPLPATPVAFKRIGWLPHTSVAALAVTTGLAKTVTSTDDVLVQPLASVMVTL